MLSSYLRHLGPIYQPLDRHRLKTAAGDSFVTSSPLVATAGTTNAGIIDDLAGVAAVAGEHGAWLHVDGAYGGAGLFSNVVRDRYAGLDHADSFVVDPHKWLFAPFDCAALLYREPRLAKAVHTQDAAYLDVIHPEAEEWNPSDYAYHLTRRARGLALWFSLAVHGTGAYRVAVDAAVSMARTAAALVGEAPNLELVRDPELSVVLFRRVGWSAPDYHAWSARLLADQIGFVTPAVWEGETVARFAFFAPRHHLAPGPRDPRDDGLRRPSSGRQGANGSPSKRSEGGKVLDRRAP